MIEQQISEALYRGVTAAVLASIAPALPVKFPGRTLSPSPDKYLEVVQIVNNMQNEYWGEDRVYQGTLRLILHWPANDEGVDGPTAMRDSISAGFRKEDRLWIDAVAVKIFDHPSAGSMIEDSAGLLFPVSIPYRSFARQ